MRYLFGFLCVCALGVMPLAGCTESKQEPDLEWPPNATAYFDQYGILSADCATDEDCAMVLGYYHAADRFVQMDLRRRNFTGRLTDFVDKNVAKAVGIPEIAVLNRAVFSTRDGLPAEQSLYEQASPEVIAVLKAYSAGVNQWIDDVRDGNNGAVFPREFDAPLFVYAPDDIPEWTPQDSLAILIGYTSSGNQEALQVAAGVARSAINDDAKFSDLWSRRPISNSAMLPPDWVPPAPYGSPVATNEVSRDEKRSDLPQRLNAAPALQRLHERFDRKRGLPQLMVGGPAEIVGGTNAWAVAPSKSAGGTTLIANDSHVAMTQPAFWYVAHLDAKTHGRGQIHAAGFTWVGIPWIWLGQNEDIVWAGTNAFMDLSDVYIEELVKDAEGNASGVMFQGAEVPFKRVPFTVTFVDGEAEEHELLFVPHHGPVRELDADNNVAIALRWAGHDASTDPEAGYDLSMAANLDQARAALRKVTAIQETRVIADRQGNIGWFPYNRVPKRSWATRLDGAAPPWLPLDGTGAYEWTEYFGYDELPQLVNPQKGFVAYSNNDMTGALSDGDPTTLPSGAFLPPVQVDVIPGYRHARVLELLEEIGSEHDLDTTYRIQNDVLSLMGKDMVPGIVSIAEDELTDLSPEAEKVVNALKAWNFSCPTGLDGLYSNSPPTSDTAELLEASGCAAFHATLQELCELIQKNEEVNASGRACPSFAAFYSIVDPSQLAAGDIYWNDPDTPETETKHEVMAAALEKVYDLFVNKTDPGLGTDETKWAWGRLHGLVLTSDLDAFLQPQYNNPPPGESPLFANPGGSHIVASAYAERDLVQRFGVSMRLVCEIPDTGPACTVQLPGGQSSHIDSPNYQDLLLKFLVNEPIDLPFDIDEAKANAVRTVTFD